MRFFITLIATLVVAGTSGAEPDESQRTFGFQPLEIYKFKQGTSRLIVTDLNLDGLDDILFANNHLSRLEILMRKPGSNSDDEPLPELEARFDSQGIIVDQGLKAIRVGDLNSDGLPDIATFGTAVGLVIRYQQTDGTFGEPERIFIKDPSSVTTIQLGDLNGDERKDILVCRQDQADLHWNSEENPFLEKKTLTYSTDKSYYGDIADVNNDGLPDLAFHFNATRNPLKIRYGKGGGLYGIEQPIDLPPRQYMDILQPKSSGPKIGMVLRNRLAFRLYDFVEKEQPPLLAAQEVSPGRIGLEGTSKKAPPAWILGDFNNDESDDLLVAAPDLSRLHIYSGGDNGLDPEPQRIDTLSDVVRADRLANGDILVISKKEKIAALHTASDLTRFPRILNTPGDVLAGSAVASGNEAWFVCKGEDKELQLVRMPMSGDAGEVYPLDMQNAPSDLLAFALPDERIGLVMFMAYDTAKMYLFSNGEIEELTSESFRALTQKLTRSNMHLVTDGDGSEIIVSQGSIARKFQWKGDHYEVVRQFNPENPRADLIAATRYALLDGSTGAFIYDRNSGDLIHFADEGAPWGKIHIPDADQTIFDLVQLRNKTRDTLILLDRTGLNEITGGSKRLEAVSSAEYISPSENPLMAYAKHVELGAPPKPMVAMIDPANRTVEIARQNNGDLINELVFEVFLTSDFADVARSRGTEPHDLESGDLNGDGVGDLVALVHDKLLIYLGE